MRAANNVVLHFRAMMNQSLPLRVAFWTLISCFSIAIVLTIAYPIVDCGIFNIPMPCSHYLPDNANECSANNVDYCCGTSGSLACELFSNCQIKPTPFDIPKCAGLLIAAWTVDGLTLLAATVFFIIFYKIQSSQPAIAGNYLLMNQGIEIANDPEDNIRTLQNQQIQR